MRAGLLTITIIAFAWVLSFAVWLFVRDDRPPMSGRKTPPRRPIGDDKQTAEHEYAVLSLMAEYGLGYDLVRALMRKHGDDQAALRREAERYSGGDDGAA